jgi:LmbE family N-acetylglucosaminyl deacetylase
MSFEVPLPGTDVFVPDGRDAAAALARTTHLAIGAHQDDLEFMALHGILECFGREDRCFTGVTITDGSGSARTGPYADYDDARMREVRLQEQRKAAIIGEYSAMLQLGVPSSKAKDASYTPLVDALERILREARPEWLYLHNPCDKHDTHVACCLRTIAALRRLEPELRPAQVLGCEIWRDLDWMLDSDKQVLPVDAHPNLSAALGGVFDSQIVGGKRYDLAVQGRHAANATFFESHQVDAHKALAFAMDLSPLLQDEQLDVADFAAQLIQRFEADVRDRLARLRG